MLTLCTYKSAAKFAIIYSLGARGATSESRGRKVSKAMALVAASGAAYKNQQRIMLAVPSKGPEGPVTCTEQ